MHKRRINFFDSGYSLFELMVVIAIAGILIAVASTAYSTVQKKARDAKRIGDMKSIQQAQEQYYGSVSSPAYVDISDSDDSCLEISIGSMMQTIPIDPKNDSTYSYECFMAATGTDGYCVKAKLELSDGNCSDCVCATDDSECSLNITGTLDSYCVVQQQ